MPIANDPPDARLAGMTSDTAPGQMLLRPATPGDLAAVDRLLGRSYPALLKADYPPSILVTAVPRIARARPELLRSGTYYVVEGANGIAAAGGWTQASPVAGEGRARIGHVRHLATDPEQLRRGHAGRIMRHVLSEARAAGIGGMACLSTRTAVPFYAGLGFQRIEEVEIPLAPGIAFPAVRMSLGL